MIAALFWLFIKFALLGGFIVFACLSVSSFILYYGGIPICRLNKRIELLYTLFLYLVFIYINGFLGAYYFELVNHYNIDHHIKQKWILILFSLFWLGLWYKETIKEFNRQVMDISTKMDPLKELRIREQTGIFNKELLYHYVINSALKMSVFSFIGFILFLIFPSISDLLYGSIPKSIASW